jgi:hypothetical protein
MSRNIQESARVTKPQLHPTFPAFQRWVIDKLVGIYALDGNNVVVTIVGRWIDENEAALRQKGISFKEWRRTQGPQAVVKALKDDKDSPTEEKDGGSGQRSGQ